MEAKEDFYEAGLKKWDELYPGLNPAVWDDARIEYANAFKAGAEYACAIKDERIANLENEIQGWKDSLPHQALVRANREKDERIRELEELHAELRSLKQSIIESDLNHYLPAKENISFHDKVVLGIGTISYRIKQLDNEVKHMRNELISRAVLIATGKK